MGSPRDEAVALGSMKVIRHRSLASNTAFEMAESTFLCASADGMLWKLGRLARKGEWVTGNIWQKEVSTHNTQSSETGSVQSDSDIDMYSWRPIQLKTRQHHKVSLRQGYFRRGGGFRSDPTELGRVHCDLMHLFLLLLSDSLRFCHCLTCTS